MVMSQHSRKRPRWQKLLLILMVSTFFSTLSFAQSSVTVTGKVTDPDTGKPLPGVSVMLKGKAANGVVTDNNGDYSVTVPAGTVLVFSYLGNDGEEVKISTGGTKNISLSSKPKNFHEVVVVGYGTAKRKNVVGALDVISAKSAGQTAATSAEQLLIGKSAGVQVINTSGVPGSGAQIIIRGTGSFKDASPLYVIDGIQGDFNSVSPQDIDNITI